MLVNLRSASGTFRKTMDVILPTVKWHIVLLHSDNAVVFSKTTNENIDRVKHVLTLHYNAGVTRKRKKLKVFTDATNLLGHVIRSQWMEIASHITNG